MKISHTVTVEQLRTHPGFERVHPAVTAVVERFGSHTKVCVTSRPVWGLDGSDVHRLPGESGLTVADLMVVAAQDIAATYGAKYVPAAVLLAVA